MPVVLELAAWEILESGKPWREADADVCEAIDYLMYYGHEMLRLAPSRQLDDLPGEINEYRYQARGVAVVIAPWNFPLAILTGHDRSSLGRRQHSHYETGRTDTGYRR